MHGYSGGSYNVYILQAENYVRDYLLHVLLNKITPHLDHCGKNTSSMSEEPIEEKYGIVWGI